MDYKENVLELVGRTPLVKLNRLTQGIKATVLAKMESLNPGYSVKDRIGRAMIEAAEREGSLKPGGTIVEATSGNTGIGLVLTAAVRGERSIFFSGADPYGSVFKTYKGTGKTHEVTPYLVEGIGQEVIPENAQLKYVDEIINITDRESFEMSRQLGRVEGIFCGGSTGTNLAAALKVARTLDENGLVVFIVCDTGEHYLSKHHSDEWLKEKRLLEPQRITAELITQTKGTSAPDVLVSVAPTDRVADILARMDELGISYVPVLEEGRAVGSLRENHVLTKVLRRRELLEAPVSEVMDASFPVVEEDATAAEVTRQLQAAPAVLVRTYGRITGISTRHDVLDMPA